MALDPISAFRHSPVTVGTGKLDGPSFAGALDEARAKAASLAPGTAAQELQDYVDMTPAERMRADLLKKLGLKEEDLASMSAEERQGIETKLRDLVQQQMQEAAARQSTGTRIDTLA